MRRLAVRFRIVIALVTAACLIGAPLAGYALPAPSSPAGLADICTASGAKHVPPGGPADDGAPGVHLSHCALCLVAGGGFAPAPAVLAWDVPPAVAASGLAPDPTPSAEPVRAAQPRGPPESPAAVA
jgi:hypothetical protein